MPAQPRVVKVRGNLKNYPWGQINGLVDFQVNTDQKPQAELWFGNHAAGPSVETVSNKPISNHPELPLLMKILAIAKPLSIQVHPDQDFASINFDKLNLSDKNGKDEVLIALETVWAFAGVKPEEDRIKTARELKLHSLNKDFKSQCQEIFELSDEAVRKKIDLLKSLLLEEKEKLVFKNLTTAYPNDPGVLVASLLQFHELTPGEGLHVPPGCPHEYLQGLAVEVMTNSDNVFRMGLTAKPIDKENSLKVLGNAPVQKFLKGSTYKPNANFEVKMIENAVYELSMESYQAVLCLTGEAKFETSQDNQTLAPGEALLISGEIDGELTVKGRAAVAIHREDGRL